MSSVLGSVEMPGSPESAISRWPWAELSSTAERYCE